MRQVNEKQVGNWGSRRAAEPASEPSLHPPALQDQGSLPRAGRQPEQSRRHLPMPGNVGGAHQGEKEAGGESLEKVLESGGLEVQLWG